MLRDGKLYPVRSLENISLSSGESMKDNGTEFRTKAFANSLSISLTLAGDRSFLLERSQLQEIFVGLLFEL